VTPPEIHTSHFAIRVDETFATCSKCGDEITYAEARTGPGRFCKCGHLFAGAGPIPVVDVVRIDE
jgi:hypothetical protein